MWYHLLFLICGGVAAFMGYVNIITGMSVPLGVVFVLIGVSTIIFFSIRCRNKFQCGRFPEDKGE